MLFRILFTDSRVGTALYNVISSTTGKYCPIASIESGGTFKISLADSKDGTTLYSKTNSVIGK